MIFMIIVLRLDHRRERDKRTSTHCGLASRALGADKIIYTGEKDEKLLATLRDVSKRWGGRFSAAHADNWKKVLRSVKKNRFTTVHLTMYGIPYERCLKKLRKKNLLLIVGSEKVPRAVYDNVDYNVAVTNQPHSEVAALAVLLAGLKKKPVLAGARLRIIPQAKGKKVMETKK